MYVHISQSQKKCCLFPRYAVEYLDTAVIAHNSYKLQGLRNRSCLFSLPASEVVSVCLAGWHGRNLHNVGHYLQTLI